MTDYGVEENKMRIQELDSTIEGLKLQMEQVLQALGEERSKSIDKLKEDGPRIIKKKPFEETLLGMPISQYMVNQKTGEFVFMKNWKNATEVEEVLGFNKMTLKEQFHNRPETGVTHDGKFHWKKGHYTEE